MSTSILSSDRSCNEAVAEVTRQLEGAHFQVVRTFDLQAAQAPFSAQICGTCPYKEEDPCNCQMVVLLVYGEEQEPVSLVARGSLGRTWFDLVDTPGQRADAQVQIRIRQTLYA